LVFLNSMVWSLRRDLETTSNELRGFSKVINWGWNYNFVGLLLFFMSMSKTLTEINALLRVCSHQDKKKIFAQLKEELGEGRSKVRKRSPKKEISPEKARRIIHVDEDVTKIPIEVVAGYFEVKRQTIYNNSMLFRLSGVVQTEEEQRGGKVISQASGRKTLYSPKMLVRFKKFMKREGFSSFSSLSKKVEDDEEFRFRLSKIRWDRSLAPKKK
jgi:hypothetical protein